jgi:prepilin-type N-terminal cleavage/methylation domain-containing protein
MFCDKWHVTSDKSAAEAHEGPSCLSSPVPKKGTDGFTAARAERRALPALVTRYVSGFTLIELLVVISIMGLIAALAVPALKNLGKSNIRASASRQLLDDIGRARQLAISDHATVYMVFVRTNFWMLNPPFPNSWWNLLNSPQYSAHLGVASNLCDKQLSGYTFVSLRSAGDQPGNGKRHYLAQWQSLPDGTFIAQQKFQYSPNHNSPNVPFYISTPNGSYQIWGFNVTNTIPFPTEDSPSGADANLKTSQFNVPYIAFNYLGQLTVDGLNMAQYDEYIPLAEGTVAPAINMPGKTPIIGPNTPPQVTETPPGNSTNSMYRIVHIDRLTGRATLEYQHVQ